jgi:hypothetical protein
VVKRKYIVSLFQDGFTALMSASWNGHIGVVEELMKHQASVERQDKVKHCTAQEHITALLEFSRKLSSALADWQWSARTTTQQKNHQST